MTHELASTISQANLRTGTVRTYYEWYGLLAPGRTDDLRSIDNLYVLVYALNLRSIDNQMLTKHQNDGTMPNIR